MTTEKLDPAHTLNAPFGFTDCEKSAWSYGYREGHAAALASSPQPAAMDQGFHDGYAKGFDDGKAAASPPSAPAEVPWTMPADSQEMFSLVNKTPLLQSLLYDLNLLPEQIRTTKHWFYFQSICAHFKMAASPSAPAEVPTDVRVDDLAALVRKLVRDLRRAAPDNALSDRALDYLKRKGLAGSILRAQSERDMLGGIEQAAQWVEKRRDDYDAEHGSTDPETGTREYPGDGNEYVFELTEIADGIRALSTSPSAPAQVPAEVTALRSALNAMLTHFGMDEDEWTKPTFDQARAALELSAASANAARDEAFEAVRRVFCKLPRFSFLLDQKGNVCRVPAHTGNWVEFQAAHELFDPVAVDAALSASPPPPVSAPTVGKEQL